jgi:hypothetical protein
VLIPDAALHADIGTAGVQVSDSTQLGRSRLPRWGRLWVELSRLTYLLEGLLTGAQQKSVLVIGRFRFCPRPDSRDRRNIASDGSPTIALGQRNNTHKVLEPACL